LDRDETSFRSQKIGQKLMNLLESVLLQGRHSGHRPTELLLDQHREGFGKPRTGFIFSNEFGKPMNLEALATDGSKQLCLGAFVQLLCN
jgi:hypothetical protein